MENSNIQKEQKFLSLLQETLKQARGNGGRISRDEIEEIFASLSLEKSQLEQVEGYLKAHKIVVGTQAGDLDALPREEKDFLTSYLEMLSDIPELSDSVLEAVKISAMAGEHSAQKELSEQMMKAVVDHGTATRLKDLPFVVAGKTGSAEFSNNKQQSHAWFTGFAPADDPKIVVTVILENAGSGGEMAAPVAGKIFSRYFTDHAGE